MREKIKISQQTRAQMEIAMSDVLKEVSYDSESFLDALTDAANRVEFASRGEVYEPVLGND